MRLLRQLDAEAAPEAAWEGVLQRAVQTAQHGLGAGLPGNRAEVGRLVRKQEGSLGMPVSVEQGGVSPEVAPDPVTGHVPDGGAVPGTALMSVAPAGRADQAGAVSEVASAAGRAADRQLDCAAAGMTETVPGTAVAAAEHMAPLQTDETALKAAAWCRAD